MRKEKAKLFNDNSFQIEVFRILENISKERGINSISEWAEKANMNQSDLSKILSAKKGLTQDKFDKILKVIRVNEKELEEIEKIARENIFKRKWGDFNENSTEITKEYIEKLKKNFMNEMSLSRKFRNDEEAIEEARKIWEFMVDTAIKEKGIKIK